MFQLSAFRMQEKVAHDRELGWEGACGVGLTLFLGALGCTGSSAARAMLLMAMTMRMHISK